MNVLVACECSGIVRDAFARLGHNAWSCDLKPTERPGKHIQGNVLDHLDGFYPGHGGSASEWDLLIAHPDCTYLTVSNNGPMANGCSKYSAEQAQLFRDNAVAFFMAMVNAPIERICIENPVGIMSTRYRKPDQIIQPYWFGDDASKKTCLWLKGLAPLEATTPFRPRLVWDRSDWRMRWSNQCDSGQNALGPDEQRSADRARTYEGLAEAMAEQWGNKPAGTRTRRAYSPWMDPSIITRNQSQLPALSPRPTSELAGKDAK